MYNDFWNVVDSSKYILLVSHINPDGDTLGSVLALYDVLKRDGKKVYLYNATKDLPVIYNFLPYMDKIKYTLPKSFDLVISCDCASFDRLGIEKGNYKVINIDHHQSNDNFGDLNIVDYSRSSVGELIYDILNFKDIDISKSCAECLYTSISEDSGFFRYSRVDSRTFIIVSKLVSLGVDPSYISDMLKGRESLAKIRLLGYMYNNFELFYDAQVAYIYLSREVFEKTGARVDDTKNIVANLLDIVNVKVAVMLLKKRSGEVKASIRSKKGYDISKIASFFGGGGHPNASGFDFKDSIDINKLKYDILDEIKKGIL